MSARLAFESWQLLLPAIGLGIFAAIFLGVVFRVWRMRAPRIGHMENLPLEDESVRERPVPADRDSANPNSPASHVR